MSTTNTYQGGKKRRAMAVLLPLAAPITVNAASAPIPASQRQEFGGVSVQPLASQRVPTKLQREPAPTRDDESEDEQELTGPVQHSDVETDEDTLAMKPAGPVGPAGGPVSPDIESSIERARGGGQPLAASIQRELGESLGHDFGRVRVHHDREAYALNERLSARAFTTGHHIFFRQGEYNPASGGGRELLTHELSHVVQQSTGQVTGSGAGMTVRPVGDAFEQAADRAAQQLAASPAPAVQRSPVEEDVEMPGEGESLQRAVVQRTPGVVQRNGTKKDKKAADKARRDADQARRDEARRQADLKKNATQQPKRQEAADKAARAQELADEKEARRHALAVANDNTIGGIVAQVKAARAVAGQEDFNAGHNPGMAPIVGGAGNPLALARGQASDGFKAAQLTNRYDLDTSFVGELKFRVKDPPNGDILIHLAR